MKSHKELTQALLVPAGITLNGTHRWDPHIQDERIFKRLFSDGMIAIGESYMDGWWDVRDLPEMVARVMRTQQFGKILTVNWLPVVWGAARGLFFNLQKKSRAFQVAEQHYDIGNDLYERMLDKRLTYSCGYWKDAQTLDEAQEAKLDLVCRKIGLKGGDRVLDIGCGWGSFAIYAAEHYGARVVGVTVSKEQQKLARKRVGDLPVEIRLQDYREVNDGPYDHVVSIGMFEHVGHKNYRVFMEIVRKLLKDDGLFLLHTIGANVTTPVTDPWIEKYIFPNGILPSAKQIASASDRLFLLEDWHNFGADYEKTLLAWFKNFDTHWAEIRSSYDDRFYRMWKFYLLSMAGSFRAREMQLWQIVFSPRGVQGGYVPVR